MFSYRKYSPIIFSFLVIHQSKQKFISRMTAETNESNAKEQYNHATRALYNASSINH